MYRRRNYSETGRLKKEQSLLSKQTNKQAIGETKQQGNKNDWKQALLNINSECKCPQCPNQKT
jgi:hypothetical protein